jgi:predicted PP-loop superfamily ATPase
MVEQNTIEASVIPRFINKENQSGFVRLFKDYATDRIISKAEEKNISIENKHLEAIQRMVITTDILEATREYQKQREAAGKAAKPEQLTFAITVASLSGGAYFTSQSRSIPLEQFSPIIYVSPVTVNMLAWLDRRLVGRIMVHEIEHAVDDVLGIYSGASQDEKTSIAWQIAGAIKSQFKQHEVDARRQQRAVKK